MYIFAKSLKRCLFQTIFFMNGVWNQRKASTLKNNIPAFSKYFESNPLKTLFSVRFFKSRDCPTTKINIFEAYNDELLKLPGDTCQFFKSFIVPIIFRELWLQVGTRKQRIYVRIFLWYQPIYTEIFLWKHQSKMFELRTFQTIDFVTKCPSTKVSNFR